MVEVQKLIPQTYNQSRDFSIFTGVMQIILNELELKSKVLEKLPNEDILISQLSEYPQLRPYFRKMLKYKGTPECLVYMVDLCGGDTKSFAEEKEYLRSYFRSLPTPIDIDDPYFYFNRDNLTAPCNLEWVANTYYSKSGNDYILTTEEPVDWKNNWTAYYGKDTNNDYFSMEINPNNLTYWGEITTGNSKIYKMHINVKDQSTVGFGLLKKLEYYLCPVNTIILVDKLS